MNLKQDLRLLAVIQLLIAFFMGIPTVLACHWREWEALRGFMIALGMIITFSVCMLILSKDQKNRHMGPADGFLFVTLTWVLGTMFGAIPLWQSGACPSYANAYFEVMSGFSTTGATAMQSIEDKPFSILFWRSETNWLGGMGIVVLFVAFLPMLGVQGTMLYGAESVGPTKDKLTPKTGGTALALWTIYLGISAVQVAVMLLEGLPVYDAVTITFSTMSAAGFSVRNASIGAYQSPVVEWTITVFMFLAGVNFSLYFKMLNGKARMALRDGELRGYARIVGAVTLLIAICLTAKGTFASFLTSLRYAAFQVVSVITTTGFSTANYLRWPHFTQMLLFLLFFIGGCAGSAGGGIKVVRVQAIINLGRNSIHKRLHPASVTKNRVGDQVISDDVMMGICGFVGLYLATGLCGAVVISLCECDFATALSTSFLSLGNIGIGFGQVGPAGNFSFFPDWCMWVCSFLMLVGRLELFTVFALFSKTFRNDQVAWIGSRREKNRIARIRIQNERRRQTELLEEECRDGAALSPATPPEGHDPGTRA